MVAFCFLTDSLIKCERTVLVGPIKIVSFRTPPCREKDHCCWNPQKQCRVQHVGPFVLLSHPVPTGTGALSWRAPATSPRSHMFCSLIRRQYLEPVIFKRPNIKKHSEILLKTWCSLQDIWNVHSSASFSSTALKAWKFCSYYCNIQNHTNTQTLDIQANLQYIIFFTHIVYKQIQMCCACDI